MKLSNNFSLYELTRSSSATRLGIDNSPPPDTLVSLRALCVDILQPLRDDLARPINVNSGYRSPALNKAIGGSKSSQHMKGEAADIEVWGFSNLQLARRIIGLELPFHQLILEFHNPDDGPNSGWVHVSRVAGDLSPKLQVLHAKREDGKTVYQSGLGL